MPDTGDGTAGQQTPGQDPLGGGEPVGSLAEEAARLVAAMMTGGGAGNDSRPRDAPARDGRDDGTHTCPHGWCPLCQVVEYVQGHPEIVTQVMVAGAEFLAVVRDAFEKVTGPDEEPA